MSLMRHLLVDAQAKFRKMMEENKSLASRIDGDIQHAQHEVSLLRAELADTNKRIEEISTQAGDHEVSMPATCVPTNMESNSPKASNALSSSIHRIPSCENKDEDSSKDHDTQDTNNLPSPNQHPQSDELLKCEKCGRFIQKDKNQLEESLSQLKEQNEKLSQNYRSLQKEAEELREFKERTEKDENKLRPHVDQLHTELKQAREALSALKQDRKRLKAEKFDLLNQMKQLYGTLEDKEKELRDFIRSYEQKMKNSEDSLKQLVIEREECEREKWNILKHARDEAERSVALCAQLGLKEAQIKQLQDELNSVRERLDYFSDAESTRQHYRTNGYRSPSAASTYTSNGRESSNAPTPTPGSDQVNSPPCVSTTTITVNADSSPYNGTDPCYRPSLPGLSRSAEEIYNSSGGSDSSGKKSRKRKEGKGTWGSISRVFSRGRHRKTLDTYPIDDQRSSWSPQSSLCASPLTEESYTEKIKLLEEAQGTPMDKWKAATVLAWLEISLAMPQYGAMCAENVKSGKILLELSDHELENGLSINNVMHRRKLRLAIEEHREPSLCIYPKVCLLTHTWIVEEWLPSLGLTCYADNFASQLVDGRMLDTLTKKDLEKHLNITRKFHQVSIMHAIQLLRMVKFDRQLLIQRRSHCENMDIDPLVWSNQRFIKWAKSIDLGEFADNLKDSGVHGALVVLEPSFVADTMATALGIPASKNIIRRHLTTELENLIQPARMSLEAEAVVNSKRLEKKVLSPGSGSLGRSFMRSYSRGSLERPDKRRASMRFSSWRSSQLSVS